MPLLVLTADRPPELRDVGAGQTIDQVKLYGSAAKWFIEVDDHPATPERAALAAPARLPRVLDRARGPPRPGAPELLAARAARARRAAAAGRARRRRPRRRAAVGHAARRGPARRRRRSSSAVGDELARAAAGDRRRRAAPSATRGSAPRSPRSPSGPACRCWPSRPRARAAAPAAIAHYDALLRDPALGRARARPSSCCASATCRPPSRCASGWAGSARRRSRSSFDPENAWQDPAGAAATLLARRPARAARRAAARLPRKPRASGWLEAGRAPTARPRGAIAAVLGRRAERAARRRRARRAAAGGGDARRRVLDADPRRRDVLPGARRTPPRVLANRGANGIDGTVVDRVRRRRRRARAGRAADRRRRARARRRRPARGAPARARRSTIVLLDNDGGGIFDFLPGRRRGRRLRGARRDAARARLRPRRRALRARPRARSPTPSASARRSTARSPRRAPR